MNIRLAAPAEARTIADLMRGSFDPATLALTVYGCSGIVRHLRARMRLPLPMSDCRHLLAFADGLPAGFAETRLLPAAICLNYIAVAREYRGARNADRLLARALDMAAARGRETVLVDVFASNTVSRNWYEKLGFGMQAETAWWSLPLARHRGRPEAGGQCRADRLLEAQACDRLYGFSHFDLITPRATYRIGRLGHRWFRTCDPGLLDDECALACLALLEPGRSLLGLFPADFAVGAHHDATCLNRSLRLQSDLTGLRRRLMQRTGA